MANISQKVNRYFSRPKQEFSQNSVANLLQSKSQKIRWTVVYVSLYTRENKCPHVFNNDFIYHAINCGEIPTYLVWVFKKSTFSALYKMVRARGITGNTARHIRVRSSSSVNIVYKLLKFKSYFRDLRYLRIVIRSLNWSYIHLSISGVFTRGDMGDRWHLTSPHDTFRFSAKRVAYLILDLVKKNKKTVNFQALLNSSLFFGYLIN